MEKASDSYRWMKMDTQKQKYRKNMSLSDSEELGMMLDSWLLSFSSWSKPPSDVHIQPKGFVHVLQHEVTVALKFCHCSLLSSHCHSPEKPSRTL